MGESLGSRSSPISARLGGWAADHHLSPAITEPKHSLVCLLECCPIFFPLSLSSRWNLTQHQRSLSRHFGWQLRAIWTPRFSNISKRKQSLSSHCSVSDAFNSEREGQPLNPVFTRGTRRETSTSFSTLWKERGPVGGDRRPNGDHGSYFVGGGRTGRPWDLCLHSLLSRLYRP